MTKGYKTKENPKKPQYIVAEDSETGQICGFTILDPVYYL